MGAKMLLANPMGTLWAGMSRYGYETLSCPYAWLGAFGYSFQLYFDFAGYSLMAMGLGQMLGLYVPRNFDHPYISGSMAEFWRRWHMTLGRWFKKYLYFPLGGSRKGEVRTYINIIAVFLVSGLWHGANWTFILWGFLHGMGNALTRMFRKQWGHLHTVIQWGITFLFVNLTWIFFRADSISQAVNFIRRIFGFQSFSVRAVSYTHLTLPTT